LISAGHSWKDIQDYSFGEIQVFLSSINKLEAAERSETLSLRWMSAHLKYEGIEKLAKAIRLRADLKDLPKEEKSWSEVRGDWNRLRNLTRRIK
jgi:hypothetical protein